MPVRPTIFAPISTGISKIAGIGLLLAALLPARDTVEAQDHSPDNQEWNGASELIRILNEAHPSFKVASTLDVETLKDADSLLLLSPASPLPTAALTRFLKRGGRIALAADRPHGSPLLEAFGIRHQTLPGGATRYFQGNPELPVAERLRGHPLSAGVPWLLSNHPTALFHDDLPPIFGFDRGAMVFAGAVGSGRLVSLSDSSVFINNMLALPTHQTFTKNLVKYLHQQGGTLWLVTPNSTVVGAGLSTTARAGGQRFQRVHQMLETLATLRVPGPVQRGFGVATLLLLVGLFALWLPRGSPYGAKGMLPADRGFGGLWGLHRDELVHRDATSTATLMYKNEFEQELLRRLELALPARLRDVMTALERRNFPPEALIDARAFLLDLNAFSWKEDSERRRKATPRLFVQTVDRGQRLLSLLDSDRNMDEPTQRPLPAETLERVRQLADAVVGEVQRVFLGPPRLPRLLLTAVVAQGHVLLEGVPGVAKTTLAKTFAQTLGCEFHRIQFTPDLLPSDITGTHVLSPKDGTFSFRRGPIFANVVLGDEINRAPAKTQSALLEAMQERQVTVEGETSALPNPFLVLATQNPMEHAGTYPLPEAQIDRFLLRLILSYPPPQQEVQMLRRFSTPAPGIRQVLRVADIQQLQELVTHVHVEEELLRYIVHLSAHTRSHPDVLLGASPRASLSLLFASRAHALLSGRGYVTPDDIKAVAVEVLAHRVVTSPELELRGNHLGTASIDPGEQVVQKAIAEVSHRDAARPSARPV